MKKQKKENVEFRYYEMPRGMSVLALLGEKWEVPYGRDAMHFHNYLEIGYCYDGEGVIYLGEESFPYAPGTLTVIPRNFPHHTVGVNKEPQKWEYLFVDSDSILQQAFSGKPFIAEKMLERLHSRMFLLPKGRAPKAEALLKMIFEEMRVKQEFYVEIVRGELFSLLMELIRQNPGSMVSEIGLSGDQCLSDILETLEYMQCHYRENIHIEDLIKISHMSETHFRRKFREYMNTSPAEYINLLRVRKACELLARTTDDIADAGVQAGFQTTGTFIRNFKKFMGMVPREWRKTAMKEIDNPVNYHVSIRKGW